MSNPAPLPPIGLLREALSIDPATGRMTWKHRPADHFQNPAIAASWNAQFPGSKAFSTVIHGYLTGQFNGRRYKAHRVAFALYHGAEPIEEIDHIDGDKTNNSKKNIREVSSLENKRNLAISCTNTSGVVGVSYRKDRNVWRAYINAGGRSVSLGYFKTIEEAAAARKRADRLYGFHENHGRIAWAR